MSDVDKPGALVMVRSALFAAWMFGLAIVMGVACLPLLLAPRAGLSPRWR